MKRYSLAVATGLALLSLPAGTVPEAAAQGQAVRLVVNEANPAITISRVQASQLFLKKVTAWDHGAAALPVDQVESSSVRDAFSTQIHGRSVNEIKAYWQRMIFSGRSVPPPVRSSDREVIEFVSTHPGAVGYVSGEAGTAGVRVLQVRG
jgi:ABC-type phosphate transport system substrate-binding protein